MFVFQLSHPMLKWEPLPLPQPTAGSTAATTASRQALTAQHPRAALLRLHLRTTTSLIWSKLVLRPLSTKNFNEKTFSFDRGLATVPRASRPWPLLSTMSQKRSVRHLKKIKFILALFSYDNKESYDKIIKGNNYNLRLIAKSGFTLRLME